MDRYYRKICALLFSFILFCSACGDSVPTETQPNEPGQLQTYTAVLIDRSTEPAATSYFAYAGDTTLAEILAALAETMHVSLDLQSAEVTASAARITVGPASALCTADSETKLRGYLNSIYSTVRQNYGIDKAVFITAGDGTARFGIDLSGATAYAPIAAAAPEPGEGELTAEDAKLYAINLTYGMLENTEIELVATVNEVISIGEEYYYDVSVSSSADPGSIMRRFAISFDGLSAYLYNHKTDAFERF